MHAPARFDPPLDETGAANHTAFAELAAAVAPLPATQRLPWRSDPTEPDEVAEHNLLRASRASEAMALYADRHEDELNRAGIVISDFLTDLMHLCDAIGVDFDTAAAAAARDYTCELEGL